LHPKLEFLPELGLNCIRTYTLSSWDAQHRYLDLVVSIVKGGLTSSYFKTHPEYIRIKTIPSTFYIPEEKRPIVMIANGSGIAPFRSIAQFVEALPAESRPYLRL
jgi:ferredoxin-NADP reductase